MNAIDNRMQKQRGMTLIEVLVTVLIMSVGLMGMAALQMNTMKESVEVSRQSHGVWLVDELASRMRVNQAGLGSGYTTAAANANLCTTGPTQRCADFNDGSAKVNASNSCTANQMAEFDVWQVACGYSLNGIATNNVDNVNITDYDITCADSDGSDAIPCSPLSPFTITLTWTSRSATDTNAQQGTNLETEQTIEQTIFP